MIPPTIFINRINCSKFIKEIFCLLFLRYFKVNNLYLIMLIVILINTYNNTF